MDGAGLLAVVAGLLKVLGPELDIVLVVGRVLFVADTLRRLGCCVPWVEISFRTPSPLKKTQNASGFCFSLRLITSIAENRVLLKIFVHCDLFVVV